MTAKLQRFCDAPWHEGETGSPILDGAIAYFDCRLVAQHPGGDHSLFIGEIVGAGYDESAEPLVWYGSRYRQLSPEDLTAVASWLQLPLAHCRAVHEPAVAAAGPAIDPAIAAAQTAARSSARPPPIPIVPISPFPFVSSSVELIAVGVGRPAGSTGASFSTRGRCFSPAPGRE